MISLDDLRRSPNGLARHYSRFRVGERLLLTGHSHQAWPDVAFDAQREAFDDAAALVDQKWDAAFAKADAVRAGFGRLLGAPADEFALASNTHELLLRFLSALDLRARPRLITTDGEFHTVRRQLSRLAEAGVDVAWVAAEPAGTLAARLARALDSRTGAVLVSAVLFETARIVPDLPELAEACAANGVELLIDAYHALGPVPFELSSPDLDHAWVIGGGYKYLQLGEGNCFLRLPPQAATLRPVITGWFAEFSSLDVETRPGAVSYGPGAARFAGSTYDPTSHYRGARVFSFFAEHGLSPGLLREVYQHQVGLLARGVDELDADPSVIERDRATPLEALGGFLALRTPRAQELQRALAERGVLSDTRGDYLRLGPAPYLSDVQLEQAIAALGDTLRTSLR